MHLFDSMSCRVLFPQVVFSQSTALLYQKSYVADLVRDNKKKTVRPSLFLSLRPPHTHGSESESASRCCFLASSSRLTTRQRISSPSG